MGDAHSTPISQDRDLAWEACMDLKVSIREREKDRERDFRYFSESKKWDRARKKEIHEKVD